MDITTKQAYPTYPGLEITGDFRLPYAQRVLTPAALEFLIAGATAIQVGTANFVNPRATLDILEGIEAYMKDNGIEDIGGIIGSLRV